MIIANINTDGPIISDNIRQRLLHSASFVDGGPTIIDNYHKEMKGDVGKLVKIFGTRHCH